MVALLLGILAHAEVPDHPKVSRFAGSEVLAHETQDFDDYLVPLGRQITDAARNPVLEDAERVEGRVTRYTYLAPPGASSIEVFRSYETALTGGGFQTLFSCALADCGSELRRIEPYDRELYPYSLHGKVQEQRFIAAKHATDTSSVFIAVYVSEHISPDRKLAGRAVTQVDIVEVGDMETGKVSVDAAAMAASLQTTGRVALYGVYFDVGSDVLTEASDPTLGEIAKLLSNDPGLNLLVVGHTDMTGGLADNLTLSERRAAAVVAALTGSHGIDGSRLDAHGVGPLAPIGSNGTEAGRATNRRVELVLR